MGLSETLQTFFRDCAGLTKYQWKKTNISPKQLKNLDPNIRKFFRYRLSGNTVYLQLKRDSFVLIPRNRKRVKGLHQVQVEVKPVHFSV